MYAQHEQPWPPHTPQPHSDSAQQSIFLASTSVASTASNAHLPAPPTSHAATAVSRGSRKEITDTADDSTPCTTIDMAPKEQSRPRKPEVSISQEDMVMESFPAYQIRWLCCASVPSLDPRLLMNLKPHEAGTAPRACSAFARSALGAMGTGLSPTKVIALTPTPSIRVP